MAFWNTKAQIDDPDLRSEVVKNIKDGVTAEGAIADWGDHDIDHKAAEHNQANSRASNRDSSGFGVSTPEETAEYYGNGRREDIKPRR